VNDSCLHALKSCGAMRAYKALDWCKSERYRSMLEQSPGQAELRLAVGAQVVLVRNMRDDSGLVNGSRGVVAGFERLPQGRAERGWESNEFHARLDTEEELPLVKFAGLAKVRNMRACAAPRRTHLDAGSPDWLRATNVRCPRAGKRSRRASGCRSSWPGPCPSTRARA
jgi:hypothetical protein